MAGIVIALLALGLVAAVVGAMVHAQLVANRNHCDEAWANVIGELQRRHELVPELIETAKAHADHERRLLSDVTGLVTEAVQLTDRKDPSTEHQAVEARLEAGINQIVAQIEHDPEARADRHFVELQRQLVTTADRVQSVLRFYNGNVRAYNNTVQQFPARLVAGLANSKPRPYFRIEEAVGRDAIGDPDRGGRLDP